MSERTPERAMEVLRRMGHPGITFYPSLTEDVDAVRWACAEIARLQADLAAAQAERDALRDDAERYRFIRSHKTCIALYELFGVTTATEFEKKLDATIDAARKSIG